MAHPLFMTTAPLEVWIAFTALVVLYNVRSRCPCWNSNAVWPGAPALGHEGDEAAAGR